MTLPVICRPGTFPIRRILACPTCKKRRRMAGIDCGPWYGPTLTCLGCGDAWTCGEMHERPFRRAWRQEAKKAARKAWLLAGEHTRTEYQQWLRGELEAATTEESPR